MATRRCGRCAYFEAGRCYGAPPAIVVIPQGSVHPKGAGTVEGSVSTVRPTCEATDRACPRFQASS